ncbi:aldo/keto reductase [Egibacter rhizosphaerae]|uniref:aldo/keto reductase n=1 Tax=Egibacter rhizosphaerae TaxID=1670831 RepID=UPI00197B0116|nr:aldo/keto reductase [Egibacter rhizosphaerae]
MNPVVAEGGLSALSLGTMTFGEQVDEAEAARMVASAREAGITMFDTADAYRAGRSEEILGKCLVGIRDEVLVASKVGLQASNDPEDRGLRPERIRRRIRASLARLGTDYLDVYCLHAPDRIVPLEESLGALTELVDEGLVRWAGVSNHAAWQIAEMRCLSTWRGDARIELSQVLYNVLARRLEDEYAEYATTTGLASVVYNPLAGGLLTGKHTRDEVPAEGRFSGSRYRERYWNDTQFDGVARLHEIAAAAGLSLTELAIRWLRSRTVVDSVLVGASSVEQLEGNLAAGAAGPLPADVVDACDEVWQTVGGAAPGYNR